MTEQEKCFAALEDYSGYNKFDAVNKAARRLKIPIDTVMEYYPAWRKSFTRKPIAWREKDKNHLPELTQERCLEECKKFGTSEKAMREIAERYNISSRSLYFSINKWKIRDKLKQMKLTRS